MNPVALNYQWVLLALTLWREARGCTHDQKRAVAHVIANRAASPRSKIYGGPTLVGVLIAPMQFTSIAPPRSSATSQGEWFNATTWPREDDGQWVECCAIADAIGQATDGADPTGGATNYYSDPIANVPAWAQPQFKTVTMGPFHFFRLP